MTYLAKLVPKRPEYTLRLMREWDLHVKYITLTKGNIVEIGCNAGDTTVLYGTNFPNRQVFAIDWCPDDRSTTMVRAQRGEQTKDIAIKARHCPNVQVINTNSRTFDYNTLPDVTFFFIDGDHSYEGVKADTTAAIAYLQSHSGGYILLHDYRGDNKYPWMGVYSYVQKEIKLHFEVTERLHTFIAAVKVDPILA